MPFLRETRARRDPTVDSMGYNIKEQSWQDKGGGAPKGAAYTECFGLRWWSLEPKKGHGQNEYTYMHASYGIIQRTCACDNRRYGFTTRPVALAWTSQYRIKKGCIASGPLFQRVKSCAGQLTSELKG